MPKSLYLVAPRSAPGAFGADAFEHWGFPPVQGVADVALTTVAALAPPDFDVRVCDETVSPIEFDAAADFVGVTGKITQRERMIQVAEEFRRRGRTVLIGGPSASLSPDAFRGACDVLVQGEIEEIAPDLFADLRRGRWKEEYRGGRPGLGASPVPRWDLYPNDRAIAGAVQTSRGCPFDCEFCDVIPYLGRRQRHKPVERILNELDVLYRCGYRGVFLTDDNFTVHRNRAREVTAALRDWNRAPDREPVVFTTQASIEAARDEELLESCSAAGLNHVFIGIETPNRAALRETRKRQNLLDDPLRQVRRFLAHGVMVRSGMVVGFDADGPDIFERQFEFAMSSPIPIFSIATLAAPEATPLHARMRESGRLIEGRNGTATLPWETNVVPARMTGEQMSIGMRWLANRLYHPSRFGDRVVRLVEDVVPSAAAPDGAGEGPPARRRLDRTMTALMQRFLRSDAELKEMGVRLERAVRRKPFAGRFVRSALRSYVQIRCLYDRGGYWDPGLARLDAPPIGA